MKVEWLALLLNVKKELLMAGSKYDPGEKVAIGLNKHDIGMSKTYLQQ